MKAILLLVLGNGTANLAYLISRFNFPNKFKHINLSIINFLEKPAKSTALTDLSWHPKIRFFKVVNCRLFTDPRDSSITHYT